MNETNAQSTQVVRGELAFDGAPVNVAGASLRIVLNDVSRADGAAVAVGEQPISALPHGTTSDASIPFELRVGPLSPRSRYALWAHVDMDRDGQVSVGDFITMESFPVIAGDTSHLRVRVRRVG
jgi:uncharacterized lipoprotein YbaY